MERERSKTSLLKKFDKLSFKVKHKERRVVRQPIKITI